MANGQSSQLPLKRKLIIIRVFQSTHYFMPLCFSLFNNGVIQEVDNGTVNGHFLIKDHWGLLLFLKAIFHLILCSICRTFSVSEFFFSGDCFTHAWNPGQLVVPQFSRLSPRHLRKQVFVCSRERLHIQVSKWESKLQLVQNFKPLVLYTLQRSGVVSEACKVSPTSIAV